MTNRAKLMRWPRRKLRNLHPPFYGWFIVASATVAFFCSAPGQSYGFAIFIDAILADTGLTRTQVSALYALGTGVSALTTMLVGRLVDYWGARRVLALVGLCFGAACFLMASARGWLSVLLGFAALRALGQGSLAIIPTLLVAQWFAVYRGRAVSVLQLGGAASNALFPPLALSLILALGWRDAYRVLGVAVWLIIIPLAIVVVRSRPEAMGLRVDGLPPLVTGLETPIPTTGASLSAQIWRTRQFWEIVLPLTAAPFLITAVIFHQTSIFASRGLLSSVAASAFVPMAIAAALVAMISGVLVDRFGPRMILFIFLGLLLLAVLQLQFLGSALVAIIYAGTIGCVLGMQGVASGVIWVHYYGREGLGRIQGTASMVMISAAALAPLPLAALQQPNGSYSLGLGLYALLPIACAGLLTKLKA